MNVKIALSLKVWNNTTFSTHFFYETHFEYKVLILLMCYVKKKKISATVTSYANRVPERSE